jgi:hypothetical protein
MFADNEFVTKTSYKIVHKMAQRENPFTDSNFVKECKMETKNDLCPKKADLVGRMRLWTGSMVRIIE